MAQGAGLFSSLGGYLKGAGSSFMGTRAGTAVGNWGQLAKFGWNSMGRTGKGAVIGGAAGALYGGLSADTSVLGGAMMGAGLGAGGARYGGAGVARARGMYGNTVFAPSQFGMAAGRMGQAFGRGVADMARKDLMRARVGFATLRSNAGAAWAGGRMGTRGSVRPIPG